MATIYYRASLSSITTCLEAPWTFRDWEPSLPGERSANGKFPVPANPNFNPNTNLNPSPYSNPSHNPNPNARNLYNLTPREPIHFVHLRCMIVTRLATPPFHSITN